MVDLFSVFLWLILALCIISLTGPYVLGVVSVARKKTNTHPCSDSHSWEKQNEYTKPSMPYRSLSEDGIEYEIKKIEHSMCTVCFEEKSEVVDKQRYIIESQPLNDSNA